MRCAYFKRCSTVSYVVLLAVALTGCGGGNQPAAAPMSNLPVDQARIEVTTQELASTLGGTAAPAEIDAALWGELTAELARVISARGTGKLATAPPLGWRNVVGDLHIEAGASGEFILAWTYVSAGDYDQNSEVGVSDLTPIGVNFGATPASISWGEAQLADGDTNGQVSVSDITPIGQNFLARTTSYNIYASADQADYPAGDDDPNGAGAVLVGTVAFETAAPDLGGRQVFHAEIDAPVDGDYYWVRPNDGETDGARSNITNANTRGDWWMHGREPMHHGRSPAFGPRSNNVAWTVTTGGEIGGGMAVRGDGWIYIGSDDDSLYAINPQGGVEWTFPTGGDISATPAIAAHGTVYFGSWDGHLYAVSPRGTLVWSLPSAGGEAFHSPSVGSNRTIYVGCNDNNLYAVLPDMTVDWTYPAGDAIHGSPAIGPDGAIYFGSFDNNVYALNADGSERWVFPTGDYVRHSVTLADDGTVYAGSDDGFLYAISPAGEELWRFDTDGDVYIGPAIGADGALYVGSMRGSITALNPNGSERWRFRTDNSVLTSPAIGADGLIYTGDRSGYVYAINQDGTQQWRYETGDDIGSGLAIGGNGVLYAGSNDGNMYAFGGGEAGTAPTVDWMYDAEGITGTEITLSATASGTPPFDFSWNFAGAATPVAPEGAEVTVTLGAPGIYTASVTAGNGFEPDNTREFDVYVHSGEPPASGWIHSWGGYAEDDLYGIVVDSSGLIHAIGMTYSFADGNSDLLLLEYDADGNLVSSRTWGTAGREWVYDVTIDSADNIYIAGSYALEGDEDVLLARIDAAGDLVWARSWDYSYSDMAHGVGVFDAGGIVVSGMVDVAATDSYGALLMWWDQDGVLLSALVWDSEDSDSFSDVALGGGDWAYAAGKVENWSEDWSDLLVFRVDDAGAITWAKALNTLDFQEWWVRAAVDDAGDVYMVTHSPVIAKYNSLGDKQWVRTWTDSYPMGTGAVGIVGTNLLVGAGVRFDNNYNAALFLADTDGEVSWGREYIAAYDDDYLETILGEGLDTVYIGGNGAASLGTWHDLPVAASTVVALNTDAAGASFDVTLDGIGSDVAGVFADVTGVEDTGGGMVDVVVYNLDLSD